MCDVKGDDSTLRAARIHAETLAEFSNAQDSFEGSLPAHINERAAEGVSYNIWAAALAVYRQERRVAKDKGRKRSGKREPTKVVEVKLHCDVCGQDYTVALGKSGRPRKWHTESCRQKAIRIAATD